MNIKSYQRYYLVNKIDKLRFTILVLKSNYRAYENGDIQRRIQRIRQEARKLSKQLSKEELSNEAVKLKELSARLDHAGRIVEQGLKDGYAVDFEIRLKESAQRLHKITSSLDK